MLGCREDTLKVRMALEVWLVQICNVRVAALPPSGSVKSWSFTFLTPTLSITTPNPVPENGFIWNQNKLLTLVSTRFIKRTLLIILTNAKIRCGNYKWIPIANTLAATVVKNWKPRDTLSFVNWIPQKC